MKLADIITTLDGKQLAGGESDRSVGAVVANDLMSDVLLNDSEDILLLTSLASDQAIRTANIVGAMCVVVHAWDPARLVAAVEVRVVRADTRFPVQGVRRGLTRPRFTWKGTVPRS